MNFNRFVFDNYLQTNEGNSAKIFFDNFLDYFKNNNIDILFDFISKQYLQPLEKENIIGFVNDVNLNTFDREKDNEFSNGLKQDRELVNNIENAGQFFNDIMENIIENNPKIRELLPYIENISIFLYYCNEEYFFPYFFNEHFFRLENIFNEFNIPLPPIPSKVKHKERLFYYFELCKSLYEFRKNIGLSPKELNIFLYYFSKRIIEDIDIRAENLPAPTKVYISGATKDDCTDIIAKSNETSKSLWAGNVNTLPGDIIIIYGVTPFSQINSIWRAISKGFIDPFSYWYNLIWVGHPIKIPAITYQELVENKIWGNKSIVKSHMQGVSGVQCTVDEYNEISNILLNKDFNIKLLPKIEGHQLSISIELNNERDIEIHLLEPFLNKLGFSEKNWVRQMSVRMGRGERVYPDYAINAIIKRGEESAEFIWEAKYRITNKKHLLEDFIQAKSYALRLNSIGLGLVSLEGIWLSYKKDSFMFDRIIKYSWDEINNSDIFNKILLEIGNKSNRRVAS
jgi:hypothetical protein